MQWLSSMQRRGMNKIQEKNNRWDTFSWPCVCIKVRKITKARHRRGKKEIVFLPAAELIFEAHHDGRSSLLDAIYSLVIHQRSHLPSQQNQHLPQYTLTAAGVQYRGWMQNLSRYLSSFPEPAPADVLLSLINHLHCFLSDSNLGLKL